MLPFSKASPVITGEGTACGGGGTIKMVECSALQQTLVEHAHNNYIFAQENRDGKSVSVLSDQ